MKWIYAGLDSRSCQLTWEKNGCCKISSCPLVPAPSRSEGLNLSNWNEIEKLKNQFWKQSFVWKKDREYFIISCEILPHWVKTAPQKKHAQGMWVLYGKLCQQGGTNQDSETVIRIKMRIKIITKLHLWRKQMIRIKSLQKITSWTHWWVNPRFC